MASEKSANVRHYLHLRGNGEQAMDWHNNPCITVNILELSYVHLSNDCQYIFIINILLKKHTVKERKRRGFSRYGTEEWKGSQAKK